MGNYNLDMADVLCRNGEDFSWLQEYLANLFGSGNYAVLYAPTDGYYDNRVKV